MKIIEKKRIKTQKKFKRSHIHPTKKSQKLNTQTQKKLLLIIFLIILLFPLYFKNIFLSKYNKKNDKIELSQLKKNINISLENLESHFKLLLPKKKNHNIPKINPEDKYNLFKLENSYDYKKMKDTGKENYIYYACSIATAKHENLYVREFVEYYLKLGVEKFYFGDDNPEDIENLSDVLNDYIQKGIVDIEYIYTRNLSHHEFFDYTFKNVKLRCKWFFFYDLDEFLEFTNKTMTLKSYLEMPEFDKCNVIRIHWMIYDDNNLVYYDDRPVNERFTHGLPHHKVNIYHKSIVRGKDYGPIVFSNSPHQPDSLVKNQCDALGNIEANRPGIMTSPKFKLCYIKHFKYRTAEEFAVKLLRGRHKSTKLDFNVYVNIYFEINKFTEEKLKVIEYILNRTFPKYHKNNYNSYEFK